MMPDPSPLQVARFPFSSHPWRLTWQGQRIESAYCWRTKREAEAMRQALLPLTDWTQHPDTWDAATRARVLAVLEATPSAVTLRRVQRERRAPGGEHP